MTVFFSEVLQAVASLTVLYEHSVAHYPDKTTALCNNISGKSISIEFQRLRSVKIEKLYDSALRMLVNQQPVLYARYLSLWSVHNMEFPNASETHCKYKVVCVTCLVPPNELLTSVSHRRTDGHTEKS